MDAVAKINQLKLAIVNRVNRQLTSLQFGKPYEPDELVDEAIQAVEFLNGCNCEERYFKLIDHYCIRLN